VWSQLPTKGDWVYEIKLDGHGAQAMKKRGIDFRSPHWTEVGHKAVESTLTLEKLHNS
jgi:hypothetical protein